MPNERTPHYITAEEMALIVAEIRTKFPDVAARFSVAMDIDVGPWLEVYEGKRGLCGNPIDERLKLPCVRPEGHDGDCHSAR
jgi:hypothetical protein